MENKHIIVALYQFRSIENLADLQTQILKSCQKLNILGTLILAREGINGTVSGERKSIDQLLAFLSSPDYFPALEFKESFSQHIKPFIRLKVKIKKEIVTMGVEGINPLQAVGTYLSPGEWNEVIQDPEVLLIDGRNSYEYELGRFPGTIDTGTKNFREFPQWAQKNLDPSKHKKIAMFCTGGIRCEKASSLLKQQGFEEVYHLKGGILSYLEKTPKDQSLWEGQCYVFDNRVTVDQDLNPGTYDVCHGCRQPITEEEKKSDHYMRGVYCPKCYDKLSPRQIRRFAERQKQIDLAKKRGERHIGAGAQVRQSSPAGRS